MYTAKLLSRCLSRGENSRTYGDMGDAAFGLRGRILVSMLFLTELITSRYVTMLLHDSLINIKMSTSSY